MYISAVDGNPRFLNVEDILYIQAVGDQIVIRTRQKKYHPISTIRDYSRLLMPFGFEIVSKNSIVQSDKIVLLEPNTRIAYFDKERQIEGIKVTRRNLNKIL